MLLSKKESGFYIVKDNNQYKVMVKKDTLVASGKFVKEDRFATYQDLDINDKNEEIILSNDEVDESDINKDFFQMEERGVWLKLNLKNKA